MQKTGDVGTQPATPLQNQSGRDEHSLIGDAMFIDPAHGNYDVKDGSPVLALGFVNFPMDQFGVQKPELKALAHTPLFPGAGRSAHGGKSRDASVRNWRGARVRNVKDEGEMSVYGLPGVTGVLVLNVEAGGPLAQAGLRADDVILSLNGSGINQLSGLFNADKRLTAGMPFTLTISRRQQQQTLTVPP